MEPNRLQQVVAVVRRAGLNEQTLAALRETFSDIHFTSCLDDDVGNIEPAHREAGFNVYLVDGREHCLKLTADIQSATGLLLAQVDDAD